MMNLVDWKKNLNGTVNYDLAAKQWSWLRVGGKPEFTYSPSSIDDLIKFIKAKPKEIKHRTFGAGSNIIIRDSGFDGVFIKLNKNFRKVHIENNEIIAQTNLPGDFISNIAMQNGMDLSFLTIPGHLGGLIKMNAGAHGMCMQDIIKWVKFIDENGEIHKLSNEECQFQYRKSIFKKEWVIIEACLKGTKDSPANIQKKIIENNEYRKNSQPTAGKMAGCFFKNPDGCKKAWQLVQEAKIQTLGDAEVSKKHANFIINKNNASAFEVECLAQKIRNQIFLQHKIWLEMEVEIIE